MDAIDRIQQEYLFQQGLDYTPDNVKTWGLDTTYLHVLYDDADLWIILYKENSPTFAQRVVNVVYKDTEKRMEGMEV